MKDQKGWIIVRNYKYKGKQQEPISIRDDKRWGKVISGYIYVYPTKQCALNELSSIENKFYWEFEVIPVHVKHRT